MVENFREGKQTEEEVKQVDRLPLKCRNLFQVEVFKILIVEKKLDKNNMDEMRKYGKDISDFIDNPDNIQVRGLILKNKFEEAAAIMLEEIRRLNSLDKAA